MEDSYSHDVGDRSGFLLLLLLCARVCVLFCDFLPWSFPLPVSVLGVTELLVIRQHHHLISVQQQHGLQLAMGSGFVPPLRVVQGVCFQSR